MIFFFLILLGVSEISGETATVRGVLACQGKTLANITIQLWEKDIDPDDRLSSVLSGENGEFEITGGEYELTGKIEPYIFIEHTCNVKLGCKRSSTYVVPKAYLNGIYEMTIIILDVPSLNDKVICSE